MIEMIRKQLVKVSFSSRGPRVSWAVLVA